MNSFQAQGSFSHGGKSYEIARLNALADRFEISKLPFSIKILLENLLRNEDGIAVTAKDIEAVANWQPQSPRSEIAFTPARVLMQDFTGVPAVVDLAAMRDAMVAMGGDPAKINPLSPAELVIDHSVQVDQYGKESAFTYNAEMEAQRNRERYQFLRWGQNAFQNFKVVPPDTGIVHQINLEYLARVVFTKEAQGKLHAYPDTLVGTDSHTTMINGLGVLGWGVGGIEAEAAMLGQPLSMLLPDVVGFRLEGRLPEGATATDLVLTVTQMLREKGVVGKFVEFFGPGLDQLSLSDRATIANMAPEYGATCGLFPIDEETLRYLQLSGRDAEQVDLVRAYAKEQGMFRDAGSPEAKYTDTLDLDIGTVVPCIAGPKRPQDRIALSAAASSYQESLKTNLGGGTTRADAKATVTTEAGTGKLRHGSIVIGAITSCTNTSNPAVMLAAGLVAKKAHTLGLKAKPWVKTSLAPGSKVVTEYLQRAGLLDDLAAVGFHLVGYGCTTCIGNSGPLHPDIHNAIKTQDLCVASVLSGNRNFEGRVHALVKLNYLASPPLVVAYSIAGHMEINISTDPIAETSDGKPVFLKDLWPSQAEISEAISTVQAEMFTKTYSEVFEGDSRWNAMEVPSSQLYEWEDHSTYIRKAPFFDNMGPNPEPVAAIKNARVLALLGDSVTTDHISPAGAFTPETPAGQYLQSHGVDFKDFNSYGSRRGNHEVMMRGTFANVRLRNQLAPGTEGGFTRHMPSGEEMTIFDAAMRYQQEGTPTIVLAGKEYGTGSSRDWAAKGPRLLGVKAAIAQSFERIHRSNLVGMGVLPLQFQDGDTAATLGLTGEESYEIQEVTGPEQKQATVTAIAADGSKREFTVHVRIDTPKEFEYYQHGGILNYVLRNIRQS